ncbi:hypothetical protein Bpla01_57870 [Burkholderia plantarii]|nr:hypothetical protein Bpla01_57870 [Burkholderia plantarii]
MPPGWPPARRVPLAAKRIWASPAAIVYNGSAEVLARALRRPARRPSTFSHRAHAMTDHTSPIPDLPAGPTRDPAPDTGEPAPPGHPPGHHDSPQQPHDAPPDKDPV